MPQPLNELDIVILGAGPAGLAAARLLHVRGVRSRVLEKDAGRLARTQGGSLDLGADSGLRTLAAAGLRDAFDRAARPQGQHTNYFDTGGTLLLATDESDEDEARPEIDRLVLAAARRPDVDRRRRARDAAVHRAGRQHGPARRP